MARKDWRKAVESLQESPNKSLKSMEALTYPIDDLEEQDVSTFTTLLLTTPTLQKPYLVEKWSKVIHSICTVQTRQYQLPYISSVVANNLTDKILFVLKKCTDPVEPLYALSSLVRHSSRTSHFWEGLVSIEDGVLIKMAAPDKGVKVQRASLDYIASICQHVSLSVESMVKLIDCLLLKLLDDAIVKRPGTEDEQSLLLKLQVSILRVLHIILPQFDSFSVHLLPSLLATLKVAMTTGLPGHQIPLRMRPLEPHPDIGYVNLGYQAASVAGPKQSKIRRKIHSDHPFPGHALIRTDSGSGEGEKSQYLSSESDSEVSDSEITTSSSHIRQTTVKIRVRALNCLSIIFQSLERQPTFSYGFSFLPHDTPTSNPPPSLLTCLAEDSSYKCHSAAISVLMSILDNSKPFLAMASDQSSGSTRPFTSYSSKLGGVISELHRSLLEFISKEKRGTSLTQAVKCLSILVSNTSYHKLKATSYITEILSCLGSTILVIKQTDVSIACLTCYGALISLSLPSEDSGKSSLPRREMEAWLEKGPSPNGWPWIVDHCVQLIKQQDTKQSLLMEAVQVLTALVKFYFPQIKPQWTRLANVYFECLVNREEPIQLHALKFLDEIGRTLATRQDMSDEIVSIMEYWERLLSIHSPSLLQWLEDTHPLSCSHSCSVLATIGNTPMSNLSVETKKHVLPLVQNLSKNSNPSIKSSAIRTLGIFSQYSSRCFDVTFILDVCDSITKGLDLKEAVAVRIQASWSIGNMTDSLIHEDGRRDQIPMFYESLSKCVVIAMGDIEKVKVNAFRAAGNLLHVLTDEIYLMCERHVRDMCSRLAASINVGIMKSRWNACYACHNAYSNPSFLRNCSEPMLGMIESLCSAVVACKNFKVRTNAALALGSPSSYPSLEVLEKVWATVLKAIENSEDQPNFTEYQQTSSLRMQLCQVFCKLINAMEDPSATIRKYPPSEKALELLQKPIKEIIESTDEHSEKKKLIDLTVKRLRESSDCLQQEEKQSLNQEDILITVIASFDISIDDCPALIGVDQCLSNMSSC